MDEELKKVRGGKRPGSGRPKGSTTTGAGNPANRFGFVLPEEVARWLDAQGGSLWAKQMVMAAYSRSLDGS